MRDTGKAIPSTTDRLAASPSAVFSLPDLAQQQIIESPETFQKRNTLTRVTLVACSSETLARALAAIEIPPDHRECLLACRDGKIPDAETVREMGKGAPFLSKTEILSSGGGVPFLETRLEYDEKSLKRGQQSNAPRISLYWHAGCTAPDVHFDWNSDRLPVQSKLPISHRWTIAAAIVGNPAATFDPDAEGSYRTVYRPAHCEAEFSDEGRRRQSEIRAVRPDRVVPDTVSFFVQDYWSKKVPDRLNQLLDVIELPLSERNFQIFYNLTDEHRPQDLRKSGAGEIVAHSTRYVVFERKYNEDGIRFQRTVLGDSTTGMTVQVATQSLDEFAKLVEEDEEIEKFCVERPPYTEITPELLGATLIDVTWTPTGGSAPNWEKVEECCKAFEQRSALQTYSKAKRFADGDGGHYVNHGNVLVIGKNS